MLLSARVARYFSRVSAYTILLSFLWGVWLTMRYLRRILSNYLAICKSSSFWSFTERDSSYISDRASTIMSAGGMESSTTRAPLQWEPFCTRNGAFLRASSRMHTLCLELKGLFQAGVPYSMMELAAKQKIWHLLSDASLEDVYRIIFLWRRENASNRHQESKFPTSVGLFILACSLSIYLYALNLFFCQHDGH